MPAAHPRRALNSLLFILTAGCRWRGFLELRGTGAELLEIGSGRRLFFPAEKAAGLGRRMDMKAKAF